MTDEELKTTLLDLQNDIKEIKLKLAEIEIEGRNEALQKIEEEKKKNEEKKKASPVSAPILVALIGILGTGILTLFQLKSNAELEKQKFTSSLILKALDKGDQENISKMLLFLVNNHLIEDNDSSIRKAAYNPASLPVSFNMDDIGRIAGTPIHYSTDSSIVSFSTGMNIDADGSPFGYHPPGKDGLDFLANAGSPGNWWGLITDNGLPSGNPVIQKAGDPAPGYYISYTVLQDTLKARTDPSRYVNASTIPYIVVPRPLLRGNSVHLGSIVLAYNNANKKYSFAIVADIGPNHHIGEGSIKLAENLGINSSLKTGGARSGINFFVFKNVKINNTEINNLNEIERLGNEQLSKYPLAALLASLPKDNK